MTSLKNARKSQRKLYDLLKHLEAENLKNSTKIKSREKALINANNSQIMSLWYLKTEFLCLKMDFKKPVRWI